ncbi:hypothetical protein MNBD_GAMMA06-1130 [hydrothermal vent metagenome]|uniref:DUF2975 domain-containing protein n=1 Tax=hydrothermal vent metagenome TaxID=652676 RepID=A0A3B0WC17_9ZZZZ
MKQIERAGKQLKWGVLFLLFFSPILYASIIFWQGPNELLHLPNGINLKINQVSIAEKIMLFLLPALTPATYWFALYFIFDLSKQYATGKVFTFEAIKTLRRIGIFLLLTDFVYMLQIALTGPLLSGFGLTESFLHIELKLGTSIVGLFILLITRVMLLALELNEQQRLTI